MLHDLLGKMTGNEILRIGAFVPRQKCWTKSKERDYGSVKTSNADTH